jgi:hypothetical protein
MNGLRKFTFDLGNEVVHINWLMFFVTVTSKLDSVQFVILLTFGNQLMKADPCSLIKDTAPFTVIFSPA